MTRITDERLKELRDKTVEYFPGLPWGRDLTSALDELIERRAATTASPMNEVGEFQRAWLQLEKLPGVMMHSSQVGRFGPVPASCMAWVTTSEKEAKSWGDECIAVAIAAPGAEAAAPAGLNPEQEPKYTVNGSAIINRASGEAIPADEPVFIFRARDRLAADVLGDYAAQCPNGQHAAAVSARSVQFSEWAQANPDRMKDADTAPVVAQEPPPGEQQALLSVAGEPQASAGDRRGIVKMVANMLRRDNTPSRNEAADLLESAFEPEAPAVPAIDYVALIDAARSSYIKVEQGTRACVAFKLGAEWFRSQCLAAAPTAPAYDYKTWYVEAMAAGNEAGFVGLSAAETIRALAAAPTVPVATVARRFNGSNVLVRWEAGAETLPEGEHKLYAAAPAVVPPPPKMTEPDIIALRQTANKADPIAIWGVTLAFARAVESARDEQWRAAIGGKV